jgi:glycosyltransferase involved in cell wall biosynthesis
MNIILQYVLINRFIGNRYDVIHAHLPLAEILLSLCNKSKTVFVASKHNVESFHPKHANFFSVAISRLVSKRFDGIIFISKAVKKFLIERGEISINKLSKVIYYGVDNEVEINYKKSKVYLDLTQVKIGTISRLVRQKDIPTLLNGCSELSSIENIHIYIVGRGILRKELQNLALVLKIEKNIEWIDQVENVQEFYKSIDIFSLTSIYEGLGLVLLEAMQAGKPIIAARNSAILEVLGENFEYYFETSNVEDYKVVLMKLMSDLRKGKIIDYSSQINKFDAIAMEHEISNFYKECGAK